MGARLASLAALLVLPTAAVARPNADPLRPPADRPQRPPSAGQRASARAHYARATRLFREKDYEGAHHELELAYQLAPESSLHYAIALVDIELDHCDEAIAELEMFLGTPHGPNATKAARDAIDTCKAKLAPPPPPPTPPPPAPAPAPRPVPKPVTIRASAPRHWYRDGLGDGLVLAGTASGVASLLLYRQAVADLDAADAAMTLPDHARHVDDAHRMRTYSLVAAGSGLALVTLGVVRYLMHDRGEERPTGVAVIPAAGGGVIAISGSFE